jgi:hypothetical protein
VHELGNGRLALGMRDGWPVRSRHNESLDACNGSLLSVAAPTICSSDHTREPPLVLRVAILPPINDQQPLGCAASPLHASAKDR